MPASAAAKPIHHVFVDYENVQDIDPALIGNASVTFTFLIGAKPSRFNAPVVEKLVQHAASVHFVRLTATGKNAVDFALAYYAGKAAALDPTARIYIISRDTGYDPLIAHLRSQNVHASRYPDVKSLLAPAQAKQPAPEPKKPLPAPKKVVKPEPDLCSRITVHLGNRHRDRPKQKKALLSYLRSMFRPATDEQILDVVEKLEAAGHIRFGEKDAVVYDFKAKQDELALS